MCWQFSLALGPVQARMQNCVALMKLVHSAYCRWDPKVLPKDLKKTATSQHDTGGITTVIEDEGNLPRPPMGLPLLSARGRRQSECHCTYIGEERTAAYQNRGDPVLNAFFSDLYHVHQ